MEKVCMKEIREAAVGELRRRGYRESTITNYDRLFARLDALCGGTYSKAAGEEFARQREGRKPGAYCPQTVNLRSRVVRIADGFLDTGAVNLDMKPRPTGSAGPRAAMLAAALDGWEADMEERGLAHETKDYYRRMARMYLEFIELAGASSPDDAGPSSIGGFLAHMRRAWPGTSSYHIASNFRPFLRFLGRDDLVAALNMAETSRRHGEVAVLTDAEVASVAEACRGGAVTARDSAVTLLALTCGMRACDIIGLELGDVSWETMTISTVQRKTGNPVTVPMVPALAASMADYILGERPRADSRRVFLRSVAPHEPLADHASVYGITRRVFAQAGLDGVGAGTRLLRHTAATRLLRSGAALPVISAVLGHADPDATAVYMENDDEGMRECVLPLPKAVRA
ncbi:MAG: tyrosine-type recombinase/integrase [Eggerthellaceae bacterium]|nr:tyrosine-type recombinase/integrase [Eggerthellaceae bacterium]